MKRVIFTSVAVLGLLLISANSSEAGGIRVTFGGSGYGYYGGHGVQRGYGYPGYSTYPSVSPGCYSAPRWHDTTHYDWHPGGWQRHGNHFDYVPGHYDLHRTGHWHH